MDTNNQTLNQKSIQNPSKIFQTFLNVAKSNIGKNIIHFLGLYLISFVFIFFFSFWTSPRYKTWYGCDASFFMLVGKGMKYGLLPYKDFFDLKGPYFFLIQWLGQIIKEGKTGIFILETISMSLSLFIEIKICKKFIDVKKTFFVVLCHLFVFSSTLWGGNTIEEFFLPLNFLCIYLILTIFKDKKSNTFEYINAIIIGFSFGIMALGKITIAAPIVGIVLTIIVWYLTKKEFNRLGFFLLFSFTGLVLSVMPMLFFYAYKGQLSRMLYCVYEFAFMRSIDYGEKFNLIWEAKMFGVYFALIFAFGKLIEYIGEMKGIKTFYKLANETNFEINKEEVDKIVKERNERGFYYILLFAISIVSAFSLHMGTPFIYYFTALLPAFILGLILFLNEYNPLTIFKTIFCDICILLFLIFICYYSTWFVNTCKKAITWDNHSTWYDDYYNASIDLIEDIPAKDRDSIYCMNVDMDFFEITNLVPCYAYQINLQFFVTLDRDILYNILDYMETTPPKWMVVGHNSDTYIPEFYDIIDENYELFRENSYMQLYRLK